MGNESAAGAITEWDVNTAAGLEQGFTLESAPGERRDGEPLRVVLAFEGDLRAEAVDGGQALEFKDDAGQPVLRYDHLVVRDASGRELDARMAVRMEGGGDQAWLEVDDRDVIWPVTIDPTFTQQQKLEAGDAGTNVGANDQFGRSVAISGETVVVGAPLDDSFQGSAYVFARSGVVWTQEQKLEAADALAEDQFGFSLAISGETLVVGAPLDDGAAGNNQGSAYVFAAVADPPPVDSPPTITLKDPISLWPPNHNYELLIVRKMVRSARDAEDGNLINRVVIEQVTSDEPDDVRGHADGNTRHDIAIAFGCKLLGLRSERDEKKNGRVYAVTLRVADSAGNVTRAVFMVSVPLKRRGAPAVEGPPALTVTSRCQ